MRCGGLGSPLKTELYAWVAKPVSRMRRRRDKMRSPAELLAGKRRDPGGDHSSVVQQGRRNRCGGETGREGRGSAYLTGMMM